MPRNFFRSLLLLAAMASTLFLAADWTQFRGPGSSGASDAENLPTEWSASSAVEWKTELPGFGASSPIVLGDTVYLTCYSGYGLDEDDPGELSKLVRHIAAFDLESGEIKWNTPFASTESEEPYEGFQALHGFASATPVTDGERVFAFFGRGGVVAVSMDGKPRWHAEVGTGTDNWGSATSPVLYENLVIVNASVESNSLVALDKTSGEQVWQASGIERSWSTPILVESLAGDTELVVCSQGVISSFNPATGDKLWSCDFVDDYICPSPIAHDGVVYAIGGRRNTAVAVKAGGRGDVSADWEARAGANVGSPVYYEGHLYFMHDKRGVFYCVDAKSGDVIYDERLSPRPGIVYASPLLAGGKLYIVTRDAGTFVLAANPEFEMLAHNPPLDDSIFNGSPAVAGQRMLLRSDKYLYCLQ